MSAIVWQFEYSLALSSFGIRMKTDLFQSCGPCWAYENPRDEGAWWASIYGVAQSRTRLKRLSSSSSSWHIECSIFTASSFRICNSSTGIPSAPLALFVVMLPKVHLSLHSRMSGSRWMITRWLSGSWRSLLYSSVYSCHLFLISSVSVMSLLFLSFIVPTFAWNVPLVSPISLKRSLLFSSIYFHCSLKKAFLSLFVILWKSAFRWVYLSFSPLPFTCILHSALCKASSDNYFAFLHLLFWRHGLDHHILYNVTDLCP